DEVALFAELLDRIAAIPQLPGLAVEKRDGAGRAARVDEAFVQRDVAGLGSQGADVDGLFFFGSDQRRQLDFLTGDTKLRDLGHRGFSFERGQTWGKSGRDGRLAAYKTTE